VGYGRGLANVGGEAGLQGNRRIVGVLPRRVNILPRWLHKGLNGSMGATERNTYILRPHAHGTYWEMWPDRVSSCI